MTKQAVAEIENKAVAMAGFDAFDAMENDLGFDSSDLITPRIAAIGSSSPQLKRSGEKYVEGVEVLDIIDTSTGEILAKAGSTFDFLPVYRTKEAIRWKPKQAGMTSRRLLTDGETFDNFAASEGLERNKDYQYMYKDGDELIEHHNYFGLDLSRDGFPCFLSMKKTGLKNARKWNTLIANAKLPNGKASPRMFSHVYKIGTYLESGNGNEWPNFTVSKSIYLGDHPDGERLFGEAMRLYDIIKQGSYRAEIDNSENEVDGEIPF